MDGAVSVSARCGAPRTASRAGARRAKYWLQTGAGSSGYQPTGVANRQRGHCAFNAMPVGGYKIDVTLDSRDSGSITGLPRPTTTCDPRV
jgi:hypothetical protein